MHQKLIAVETYHCFLSSERLINSPQTLAHISLRHINHYIRNRFLCGGVIMSTVYSFRDTFTD